MSRRIPYTHWTYFTDLDAAERCRAELVDLGFEVAPVKWAEFNELSGAPWLLRAARLVDLDVDYHAEFEAIVTRFGGDYDGGEATFDPETGLVVFDIYDDLA
jgi:hypothetical protein